jgi:[acyl-carrier-protein] S-malonyltransferase
MGKEMYDAYPQAREVFDEVDDALNYSLRKLIFEGPFEKLTLTENAQPALMAVSIAVLRVLRHQMGLEEYIVAGHSLGEYSALVAANVLSLSTAARLLQQRGKAMQAAVPVNKGAMAAILGLPCEAVIEVLQKKFLGICSVANDNGANQVVISGHREAVQDALQQCLEKGAKKAIILPVSAPFHCELMQPAAEKMASLLKEVHFPDPEKAIIMNVTADFCQQGPEIREFLVKQVTATVRWRETTEKMSKEGVERFIEVGAGKVLTGLGKRMVPDALHYSIGIPADLDTLVS